MTAQCLIVCPRLTVWQFFVLRKDSLSRSPTPPTTFPTVTGASLIDFVVMIFVFAIFQVNVRHNMTVLNPHGQLMMLVPLIVLLPSSSELNDQYTLCTVSPFSQQGYSGVAIAHQQRSLRHQAVIVDSNASLDAHALVVLSIDYRPMGHIALQPTYMVVS